MNLIAMMTLIYFGLGVLFGISLVKLFQQIMKKTYTHGYIEEYRMLENRLIFEILIKNNILTRYIVILQHI